MSESSVSIRKINQLSISVTDLKRASEFYSDTLGLPLLYADSNIVLVECGGIRLLLSAPEKPEFDHAASTVYFQVDDLEASFRMLSDHGVEFQSKPHKIAEFNGFAVWMAFFYDPDRNLHALTSEVPMV